MPINVHIRVGHETKDSSTVPMSAVIWTDKERHFPSASYQSFVNIQISTEPLRKRLTILK